VLPIDYGPATDPHVGPGEPIVESVWIEPYPDETLGLEDGPAGPEARYERRESVELAFIAALQHLPGTQRAVLILREVLGFSAKEVAKALDTTVASVNSALQRARAGMSANLPQQRLEWAPGTDASVAERELLERCIEHFETPNPEALAELMHEELRFSMPPQPGVWQGRDVVVGSWIEGGFGSEAFGSLRLAVTRFNRQPALANYVRKPGDRAYSPLALDVLRIVDGTIADIVTFDGSLFGWFGLPEALKLR
jgi:RNA polymerase sigma-70 factor (ECF subfamily)